MGKQGKDARAAAQAELEAQRAAQRAAERKRSSLFIGGTVALLVVLIALVALAVVNQNKKQSDVGALPRGANPSTFGIEVGSGAVNGGGNWATPLPAKSENLPIVDLYEDFQCPACKQFEDLTATAFDKLISQGKVKAIYHPLSFLDKNFNTDASLRAASASGCAADEGKFLAFHNEVYKNQPAREGTGYTDQELLQFGANVGLTGSGFTKCVTSQKYAKWATNGVQAEGDDRGITSTPTVLLNGKELKRPYTVASLTAAITAAGK
jgi:protein-disulfide isomerase